MTWLNDSEVVTGLVLEGRISPHMVREEIFFPPYDNLIKLKKKDPNISPEDLIEKCGLELVSSAHEAVKNMNGIGELDWIKILEKSYSMYSAGQRFEKFSKKLLRGDDIDWSELTDITKKAQQGMATNYTPLNEVEPKEIPFIKSGYAPIDKHLGGIPEVGLIIVAANPKVGKTSLVCKLAVDFAREHPDKCVAFHSIEMILSELSMRIHEIDKNIKNETDISKRILLDDVPVSADEAINKAATIENLGLMIIDFSDLMIAGEATEGSTAVMYKKIMIGAKQLHCPIILISQLSRKDSGLPKPNYIRYSGLAEALAAMILMPYNPGTDWHDKDDKNPLTYIKGGAYIICWFVRGGFRMHEEESPGAILVPYSGSKGWGDHKSKWFSLQSEV